jgi:hypothetical protein
MVQWMRVFVFMLVAALAVNVQCFAFCLSAFHSQPARGSMGACHHSSDPGNHTSDCAHRPSGTVNAEVSPDLAKLAVPVSLLFVRAFCTPVSPQTFSVRSTMPDRVAPPGLPLLTLLSVLRI